MKVGVEITLMAADRGFVQTGEEIMTISAAAGSGHGHDRPGRQLPPLPDLKVKEIWPSL